MLSSMALLTRTNRRETKSHFGFKNKELSPVPVLMGEVVGHPLFGRELIGGFGFEIQHRATSRRFPGSFAETKVPVRFFSSVQKKSVISNFFAPLMNKDDFLFGLPERFLSSSETSEKKLKQNRLKKKKSVKKFRKTFPTLNLSSAVDTPGLRN